MRQTILLAIIIGLVSFCVGYTFKKKPTSGFIVSPKITPSIFLPTLQPSPLPAYTEESTLKCPTGLVKVCEAGMCDCQQQTTY